MRELKFRAFGRFGSDKQEKMIYDWQGCDLIEYVGFDGGGFFEIMQYTGLKDKNGKDIYDGDIVKYQLPDNAFWSYETQRVKTGIVEYNAELSGFRIVWEYSQHQHDEYILDAEYNVEVIGNICENKGLIDRQD